MLHIHYGNVQNVSENGTLWLCAVSVALLVSVSVTDDGMCPDVRTLEVMATYSVCSGRTKGSITISLRNFVGEGIII
jgi:hypothetical protein